ncbi:type II secretion system F family protein [Moritella sp. F3]|uniref:type II secretion system F family protein n=1 Tax=Moritella sp. F3 TaxID=2718882 RepID=UPI0018E1D1E8|nr:type II secretion system F family protein [Moritella sp. F3]GIC79611.1 pilus assembly protein TadB [Moritella sp. F1]GIC83547.1 pilus assembly protein TadB [Moritella sp. F3]
MNNQLLFLLLVFGTVVLLFQSLFISVYNPQRASAKNIRKHLNSLANENNDIAAEILLNKKIETLPPFLQWLESRPWINNLSYKMELSGSNLLGYQYLLITLASCCIVAASIWFITLDIVVSIFSIIFTLCIMHMIINRNINKRMENIEREFPEALDVLKRGLQAGYAFSDSLKLVFEETDGDLSNEFRIMFNRINYGNDIHTALLSFVKRVPTTSAMAFSSAVSIQKETGGNLAENIENLSKIIRQRFTFQRRVKTLSAEGRLSGWILSLTPFILFAGLYVISPDYANVLMGTPEGLNLLKWGGIGMFIGIWWISRLIKIEV